MQVHRDIMSGRYNAAPFLDRHGDHRCIADGARVEDGAAIEGPCFIDEGVLIKAGARVGPYSVIGRQTQVEEDAVVDGAIVWPNCRISRDATVHNAIVGRHCHLGRSVNVDGGAVLGDKTTLTDYTKA
jgi:NDP-sugar pyrophosphorylase family protein